MRILKLKDRVYFSPFGAQTQVSILTGKGADHGGFEKHTVAVVKLSPGAQLDRHFHQDREESYLVTAGAGTAVINNCEVKLLPGDLVTVAPRERHLLKADPSQSFEYVVVTAPAWTPEDVHRESEETS